MKCTWPCFCVCYVIILVSGAIASVNTDKKFRWNFKVGQTRHFVLTERKTMQMDMDGNRVHMSFTQTTYMSWKVNNVDEDGICESAR